MNYGRYKVLEELGQGSMGIVYKAHDPNLDLILAVKVLRPECLQGETLVKRFLAEARVLGRLDHPNIVRVYNVDEDHGTVYIAMEFLEGEGLNDLAKRKRLSPAEIADLGARIAEGLGYAHSKGIVHRDVKPGNILVRSDGKPKITDFGIARIEDTAEHLRTQAGEVLGTPAYMSPEQVLSEPVDGRSDIFSLGIILYELCAGERPFRGDSLGAVFQAITRAAPAPLSERNPEIPAALADVVDRCLRRDPADRFQSGEELAAALHGCVRKETPVEAAAGDVPGGARSAGKGTPAWVFAAAFVLLAAAGGGIYLFTGKRDAAPTAPPPAPSSAPKETAASSLRVSTSPAGASVFLDGAPKGVTPLRLESSPGKHEVRIALAGYEEWEARVDLAQGAELPLDVDLVRGAPPASPVAASKAPPEKPSRAAKGEASAAKAKPAPDPAVQKDLEDGITSYEQGKIDVSIVKFEYVLRQDPENARARQYLAMAQERKRKILEQWGKQLDEAPVTGGKKR